MLGTESTQHSRWSSEGDCYMLTAGSLRQRTIFSHLQETGVLRRKINRLLHAESPSFLQQSLKKAVERQLEYHDLYIASLRTAATMQLGDLEIAHRKSLPKLHALYVILTQSEAAKGGELVTRLQSLHHHGGREMCLFLGDVYKEAIRPLLHMTIQWITRGEITDPYLEFFISENPRIRESEPSYWSHRFTFREEMLPATLTLAQAKDVLLIGKNIDFIKRCCKAKDWKMAPGIVAAARHATFDDPVTLQQVIRDALEHTNAAVLHLLFNKNNFGGVLFASRSLFLVSTGDLFDAVVEGLEDILKEPLIRVNPTVVQDCLHSAARDVMPYLTAFERDALEYVQVAFDESGDRLKSAVSSFTISLPFTRPHNAILNENAHRVYQRLFRFLYKVKRAEVLLKRAWRQSIFMARSPHSNRNEAPALRKARQFSVTLYKHFHNFVSNVQMYLMTETVQGSWAQLQKDLEASKSVDDLIEHHEKYLAMLTKYTLQDGQCAAASEEVNSMLDLTFTFCELQRQLGQFVASAQDAQVKALVEKSSSLFDDFHSSMSRLLTLLEEDTIRFDFLQALAARLNFNSFYRLDPDSVTAEY
jgi:gamma-tubulin complex component 3